MKPDPVVCYERPARLPDPVRRRLAQTVLCVTALALAVGLVIAIWEDPLGCLLVFGAVTGALFLMLGVPWAVIELTERQPAERDHSE